MFAFKNPASHLEVPQYQQVKPYQLSASPPWMQAQPFSLPPMSFSSGLTQDWRQQFTKPSVGVSPVLANPVKTEPLTLQLSDDAKIEEISTQLYPPVTTCPPPLPEPQLEISVHTEYHPTVTPPPTPKRPRANPQPKFRYCQLSTLPRSRNGLATSERFGEKLFQSRLDFQAKYRRKQMIQSKSELI